MYFCHYATCAKEVAVGACLLLACANAWFSIHCDTGACCCCHCACIISSFAIFAICLINIAFSFVSVFGLEL
jgi:hypothetical protein